MANPSLQAESANANTVNDAFIEAHAAYRYAKATREEAIYAPANRGKDLPDDVGDRLWDAHEEALMRLFQTPSCSLNAYTWKLRIFREEAIMELNNADEILDALIRDADQLKEVQMKSARR
ncbi:hypothetical protein [Croceicoccus sp. YJ47]|uniref:hypothetical protein n=1 Tax=Croceicoccus sp. YJ47 TaxID=2798724 RepID=UPI0019248567|nr:hypothetical protein [Croceicoccus sp. YJ47]QQN74825.1 hypothetical protein JD971_03630 [Croceicoccus sp. YJ47]